MAEFENAGEGMQGGQQTATTKSRPVEWDINDHARWLQWVAGEVRAGRITLPQSQQQEQVYGQTLMQAHANDGSSAQQLANFQPSAFLQQAQAPSWAGTGYGPYAGQNAAQGAGKRFLPRPDGTIYDQLGGASYSSPALMPPEIAAAYQKEQGGAAPPAAPPAPAPLPAQPQPVPVSSPGSAWHPYFPPPGGPPGGVAGQPPRAPVPIPSAGPLPAVPPAKTPPPTAPGAQGPIPAQPQPVVAGGPPAAPQPAPAPVPAPAAGAPPAAAAPPAGNDPYAQFKAAYRQAIGSDITQDQLNDNGYLSSLSNWLFKQLPKSRLVNSDGNTSFSLDRIAQLNNEDLLASYPELIHLLPADRLLGTGRWQGTGFGPSDLNRLITDPAQRGQLGLTGTPGATPPGAAQPGGTPPSTTPPAAAPPGNTAPPPAGTPPQNNVTTPTGPQAPIATRSLPDIYGYAGNVNTTGVAPDWSKLNAPENELSAAYALPWATNPGQANRSFLGAEGIDPFASNPFARHALQTVSELAPFTNHYLLANNGTIGRGDTPAMMAGALGAGRGYLLDAPQGHAFLGQVSDILHRGGQPNSGLTANQQGLFTSLVDPRVSDAANAGNQFNLINGALAGQISPFLRDNPNLTQQTSQRMYGQYYNWAGQHPNQNFLDYAMGNYR